MALLSPLRQVGVVVRDVEHAMKYWSDVLQVGPFCVVRDLEFDDFRYGGESSPSPRVTIAIGHGGSFQVEIIQQHDDRPSVYRDFLASGQEGIQHLCSWYADAPSYDRARTTLLGRGLRLRQEGLARGVDVRFAYFSDPAGERWPQIEISEGLAATILPMQERLIQLNEMSDTPGFVIGDPGRLFADDVLERGIP